MSRAMATWREASRRGGLRSADFTPLPSASPKTTKTPIRILREWHEVKPQRTLYQYVTGLWACAQIVGQSHARRHDGMGCNSVPPAQLAYPRDMSYHTAPAHSCLVCKGLIPEWPKSSSTNCDKLSDPRKEHWMFGMARFHRTTHFARDRHRGERAAMLRFEGCPTIIGPLTAREPCAHGVCSGLAV
jgi:hypothetical protein